MLIDICTGNESFSDSHSSKSCRIHAWFHRNFNDKRPINFLEGRKDLKYPFLKSNSVNFYQASNYNDHHGVWVNGTYDLPDNCMVSIEILRRNKQDRFQSTTQRVLLLPRRSAAYNSARIALTRHPKAALNAVYVEGRFDIIPAEDFSKYQISVPDAVYDLYCETAEDVAELFEEIIVKEPATESLKRAVGSLRRIKTVSGKEVQIRKRKGRRIKIL